MSQGVPDGRLPSSTGAPDTPATGLRSPGLEA